MKKIYYIVILLTAFLIFASSCKDQMTYSDRLKAEEQAIDRFILKNELSILEKYPSDGIFDENEFYKDPETGVYYNIISYGDTTKALFIGEKIYVRFSGLKYFLTDDSTTYSNMNPSIYPYAQEIEFIGPVTSATKSLYEYPGWVVPLTKVGHNGAVKLIVPFSMGSSNERSQFQPTYYDRVQYRIESRI